MNAPGLTTLARRVRAQDGSGDRILGVLALQSAPEQAMRRADYVRLVSGYFDLVTDFYEYGWGQSFHFAPRWRDESFHEAILRHEYWLASQLDLRPGMAVLDVGCGVGGPMRNIARFAGCRVTGINNNDHQIRKAGRGVERSGLGTQCRIVRGDFMAMPLPDASVDAAYAIEATCHAPDLKAVYAEIQRVLKPGGRFAVYEWCMTDCFDCSNPDHESVRRGILEGNGLPDLHTAAQVVADMTAAGFVVERHVDRGGAGDIPWFDPFRPHRFEWATFRSSNWGRKVTNGVVSFLEALHLAPRGTTAVARYLDVCATELLAGGRAGIFTPAYFILGRKPGI